MDKEIQKGKSTREAAKVSAQKTGHNDNSIRSAHQGAEKKKRPKPEPSIISDVKMSPSFADAYDVFIKDRPITRSQGN